MDRISTGVLGLDKIIDGGFINNTVACVMGMPGTGKSMMALQFLLRGIHHGKKGIYFSLEEKPEKILKFAKFMGFNEIEQYVKDKKLLFVWMKGRDFKKFVMTELASISNKFKDKDVIIAVDPLTPMTWEIEALEQRAPAIVSTYRELGLQTIPIALVKGRIDKQKAEELEALLEPANQ